MLDLQVYIGDFGEVVDWSAPYSADANQESRNHNSVVDAGPIGRKATVKTEDELESGLERTRTESQYDGT